MGTQDANRHGPGNIGYTKYKQTLAGQHWVHKIQRDTGLATLGTQDTNRHWPGNIGYTRPRTEIHTHGMKYTNNKNNISDILKVYIINSIAKSYI